ncbi:MAG: hypothetical protein RI883_191 [Bacteroidota bacterium]|jgi:hypothetical protein
MKIARKIFMLGLITLSLISCTVITATNVPGRKNNSFPKDLIGNYEVGFPEDFAAIMEGEEGSKMYITFKSNSIIIKDKEGETETALEDSLYFSMIGTNYYLSFGGEPELSIFKLVKSKKSILLYPMYAREDVTQEELSQFFTSVVSTSESSDDSAGMSTSSYSVTIDESKLDAYFKSDIPLKEPYKLIKKKK